MKSNSGKREGLILEGRSFLEIAKQLNPGYLPIMIRYVRAVKNQDKLSKTIYSIIRLARLTVSGETYPT